jgi:nucleoside permease NupC
MNYRGGSVEQAVFSPPFPLIEARNFNATKPFICMAVLEAVYLLCLLLVCTEGRYVNQIFRAVRKLRQQGANGMRFVWGGCSRNHRQMKKILPVAFFTKEAA